VRGDGEAKGFPLLLMNHYSAGTLYMLTVPENPGDPLCAAASDAAENPRGRAENDASMDRRGRVDLAVRL
jgi:hypothetical protein